MRTKNVRRPSFRAHGSSIFSGRPTARDLARYGTQTSDTFGYNTRSESPRGLGGGLDNARSGIAPKGRAGKGVPASQPTQETATRPLAIQKNGTWYTYGWDLTKNICETYRTDGRIDLAYTYTPYGEVSPAHAYDQPLRWSSEYHDVESPRRLGGGLDKHEVFAPKGRAPKGVGASQLGLVYYNYRHYNPAMGRWMGRDLIDESYLYANDIPSLDVDFLGLITWPWEQHQPDEPSSPNVNIEPFIGNDKLCSTCRSKLQGLKEYILRTYKFSGGNKCLIKLDCQDPTTWESPSTGAFYLPQITPEMKKGYVSGLIALPCNACKEGIILGVKSGAYVKHGFSDYAKHEIEHAIDYCKGNTSRSYIETRAYALHQVKRGPASRQQYIVLLRYRVKASTDVAKAEFSEDEFQRAIRDLGI